MQQGSIFITTFEPERKEEVISLILGIQNDEYHISLSREEQPDLEDIEASYRRPGGEFWTALSDGHVIGTIGIMKRGEWGIMKKFFVDSAFRSKKIGLALYKRMIAFAQDAGIKHILLDTPSVAKDSHRFYEHNGFKLVTAEDFEIEYTYPDRNCLLYLKELS